MFQTIFFGLRQWFKTPLQTLIVALGLISVFALAFLATQSWSALYKNLPAGVQAQHNYATVMRMTPSGRGLPISVEDLERYQATSIFTDLVYYSNNRAPVTTGTSQEDRRVGLVSNNFFDFLETKFLLGQGLDPDGSIPINQQVVLSHELWSGLFASQPDIIGQNITIRDNIYFVVGVLDGELDFSRGKPTELWASEDAFPKIQNFSWLKNMPAQMANNFRNTAQKTWGRLAVHGVLQNGVSAKDATRAVVDAEASKIPEKKGANTVSWGYKLESNPIIFQGIVKDPKAYRGIKTQLYLLSAIAVILLFATFGAYLLAAVEQYSMRSNEFLIRTTHGAKWWQIYLQAILENLPKILFYMVLGIFLGQYLTSLMKHLPGWGKYFTSSNIEFDASLLSYPIAVAVIMVAIIAVLPCKTFIPFLNKRLSNSKADLSNNMLGLTFLTLIQIVLCLLITIGTLHINKDYQILSSQTREFGKTEVQTFHISVDWSKGVDWRRFNAKSMFEQLDESLEENPAIVSFTKASDPTRTEVANQKFHLTQDARKTNHDLQALSIDISFLEVLGIELLKGQFFGQYTTDEIIVNESLLQKLNIDSDDAVGTQLNDENDQKTYTIVGVVEDIYYSGIENSAPASIYFNSYDPEGLTRRFYYTYVLETALSQKDIKGLFQKGMNDSTQWRYSEGDVVQNSIEKQYKDDSTIAHLTLGLALWVLTLVAVGLFAGLSVYLIRNRTRFGIMIALGASTKVIVWHMVKRQLILLGVATAIAAIVAPYAMNALLPLLKITDSTLWGIVLQSVVFTLLILVIATLPALFVASKIEPSELLRD